MTIPPSDGRRFVVGRYEILGTPMNGSAQMLRYTVFLNGKRLGAMASVPTESDCRILENPPYIPEPVAWKPTYRR